MASISYFVEEAVRKGFNLDNALTMWRKMKIGEEKTLHGIKVVRETHGYTLWSDRGMMRRGVELDLKDAALVLLTLATEQ